MRKPDTRSRKWIRAIPPDNWEPSTNSGVCQHHFKPDDFVFDQTTYTNEKHKYNKAPLALGRVKNDSVPTISPTVHLISKETPKRRTGGAKSDNRKK